MLSGFGGGYYAGFGPLAPVMFSRRWLVALFSVIALLASAALVGAAVMQTAWISATDGAAPLIANEESPRAMLIA